MEYCNYQNLNQSKCLGLYKTTCGLHRRVYCGNVLSIRNNPIGIYIQVATVLFTMVMFGVSGTWMKSVCSVIGIVR